MESTLHCHADSLVKHAVWDTTKVRSKLEHHIEAHGTSVRGTELAELKANYEVIFHTQCTVYYCNTSMLLEFHIS